MSEAVAKAPGMPRRRYRRSRPWRWRSRRSLSRTVVALRHGWSRSGRCRWRRPGRSPPRWSIATASCCAPMRWPTAAGGCRSMPKPASIPVYLKLLLAYEDRRFRSHAGVDPLALGRAAFQLDHARPHRIRRLHHHDAAGAADGAAARALGLCQAAPDGPRHRDRAATDQGPDPRSLSGAGAVRRQSRRRSRRLDRLFRQGAEAVVAGGSRTAGGVAAVAGNPPPRSLPGCRAGGARPRARSHGRRRPPVG